MNAVADVVVVGGGIAGASLAFGLASGGLGVVALEPTLDYPDRVRGEAIMPWGVKEASALGVDKVLLDAGARVSSVWKEYTDDNGQPAEILMSEVIEGVPGAVNMRHPDACQAIITAAAKAGAAVVRGVRGVRLTAGRSVTVSYDVDGNHQVTAPLVVGADGRTSTVRRQSRIPLQRQDAICYSSGLLVDGLDDVPAEQDVIATDGDFLFALFHQGRGRAAFTFSWASPAGTSSPGATLCRVSSPPAIPSGAGTSFPTASRPVRARPTLATTRGLTLRTPTGSS